MRPLPLWLALPTAAGGAIAYNDAFPTTGWWPMAFAGLALMLWAQIGRRADTALVTGFVSGAVFFLTDIDWLGYYLGPIPWLATVVAEAAFWACAGLLLTWAYRWIPRAWPTRAGRLVILPLAVAGLWTMREHVTNNWPFRGFAWGRAALSQSQSPLTPLVAWLGIAGLTFLMVWLIVFVTEAVTAPAARSAGDARRWRPTATRALPALLAIAAVLAVPAWPVRTDGSLTVAAVQGDGPAGYFQPHNEGDVEVAQLKESVKLIGQKVDLMVWPEGSADLDPLEYAQSATALTELSRELGAPLVVGAITPGETNGQWFNSSLVWTAAGGATAQYDKQHPVPFGEYVPARAFFHALAPALVDLSQRDYTPGSRPNVMPVAGVLAGISICFDIIDDWQTTQMVFGGAQVILAQTNNADFIDPTTGKVSAETVQQFAAARLRAVESGRALVNVSTVGVSEVIAPDGSTIQAIPADRPGYLLATVPLSTWMTPADYDAQPLEWGASVWGIGILAVAFLSRPRRPAEEETGRSRSASSEIAD